MTSVTSATVDEQLQCERQALALAEQHVSEGTERLRRQQVIVLELRLKGFATEQAQRLADGLHATLREWMRHRDLIFDRVGYLERTTVAHGPTIRD